MTAENPDQLSLTPDPSEQENQALPKSRTDVELIEQVYYGKACYVLKDPTSLRYYRLRPPEYAIYQMLDGKADLDAILQVLKDRFPDEEYDRQTVMSFLVMLRGAGLLHIPGSSDTDYLLKRRKVLTRSLFKRIRTEYLFFRIPLFDPDKFLNLLHRNFSALIFSRAMAISVFVMLAGALFLLVQNFDKLFQAQPILSLDNMIMIAVTLFCIKWIHEFGHGLSAKYFGTEVHEMGFLLLVFMPFFYCDVSDAWMIPEKRKRMWITAGGIAVEVVLAGLAAYVWAATAPKTLINQFALNIMIATSVNTILFNGNPLLRYDGYYFLMDMLEIPNLRQKSTGHLWYLMQRYVLGVEQAQQPIDVKDREVTLITYAISATIYRWFIMIAIITMVWKFLDPYGWGVVGAVMAIGAIYSSLCKPLINFLKFITTQKHRVHMHLVTSIIILLFISAAAYAILGFPVTKEVETQCILRPQEMHVVYVSQPGFIDFKSFHTRVRDGQKVGKGQVLLQLSDPPLENRVRDFQLQIEQARIKIGHFERGGDLSAIRQIEHEINALLHEFNRNKEILERLTLKSPMDGIVQLRTAQPLEQMDGRCIPLQTDLFAIYSPGRFEAVAAINHRDHGLIEVGQEARIKLWAFDTEEFISQVADKPPRPVVRLSSPAFSTVYGGQITTMPATTAAETIEPAETTYELECPLATDDLRLRDGMVGRINVMMGKQSLGQMFYYWLIRTLRQDIRL
jgi:putative peptide zinc metalloprotease protein